MKKFGTIRQVAAAIMLLAVTFTSFAASGTGRIGTDMEEAFETIKDIENSEVINIGKSGMFIAKVVLRFSAEDAQDRAMLKLMNGTRKMTIVDYSSCSENDKSRITLMLSGILQEYEPMMEVKDDGETISFYASVSEDGSSFQDVVMFMPEDCMTIYFDGKYNMSTLAKLVEDE